MNFAPLFVCEELSSCEELFISKAAARVETVRLFDLRRSHSRVHTLLCPTAVFPAPAVLSYITQRSNADLRLTLCQQAVARPRVCALSLIL